MFVKWKTYTYIKLHLCNEALFIVCLLKELRTLRSTNSYDQGIRKLVLHKQNGQIICPNATTVNDEEHLQLKSIAITFVESTRQKKIGTIKGKRNILYY